MIVRCDKCGMVLLKQRSIPQNRYYWACIVEPLSEHLGYLPNEVHELLKAKFLSEIRHYKNVELTVVRSTSSLNTKEAEAFFSNIRIWASSDLGCFLMEPNEYRVMEGL